LKQVLVSTYIVCLFNFYLISMYIYTYEEYWWCVVQQWFNLTEISSDVTQPSNIVPKSLEDIGVVAVVPMMHKNYTTSIPTQNRRNSGKKWWVLHACNRSNILLRVCVYYAPSSRVLMCCTVVVISCVLYRSNM
jgi:hypothetical protein